MTTISVRLMKKPLLWMYHSGGFFGQNWLPLCLIGQTDTVFCAVTAFLIPNGFGILFLLLLFLLLSLAV